MTTTILTIIRANQEAIFNTTIEWGRPIIPQYVNKISQEALRHSFEAILDALAAYWEHHDETQVHLWGELRAQMSANLGLPPAQVLAGLDVVPQTIRPYLAAELTDRTALLAGLALLDEGMDLLRRSYLQAHFALQEQRLTRLHELAATFGVELSLEQILQRIVAAARELTNARYAALAVYAENHLAHFIISGLSEAEVAALGPPPQGRGLLAPNPQERASIRLPDLTHDPRFSGFPPHHPVMRAFLGVPILMQNEIYGRLYLTDKEGAFEFNAADQQLTEMLAAYAATALENTRLYRALSESQASLAEAQRIAHLGSWDWNIAANQLYWSDEVYRIFGLIPSQFGATYEAFLSAVHPDDHSCLQEAVKAALDNMQPYSIDHRILWPDGTERIVHEQAEVYFDEAGRPTRMIGTVQDITERKLAETILRRRAVSRALVGQMLRDLQMMGGLSEGTTFQAGKLLATQVTAKSLLQFLETFNSMGLGELSLLEVNETGKSWRFQGNGLVEVRPGSSRPTNHYTRGFLCGAVAQLQAEGAQVIGEEIACQSVGDPRCQFVVQVLP
jgi:PAS domain S-box-containing protein